MKNTPLTDRALDERLPSWGVAVLESHHSPAFEMEWRTHPFLKILYVLAGEGELSCSTSRFDFRPRDLLVVPSGHRNRIVDAPGSPSSLYVLCLSKELLRFDPRIERRLTAGRQPRGDSWTSQTEAVFRRLLFHQRHPTESTGLSMVVDSLKLLQSLFAEPAQESTQGAESTDDTEMARYVEYIDTHFFEPGGVDGAAARLEISRRAFTKRFRAATGESWLTYVRSRAIDHACRLLAETPATVDAVAFECGFADISTFYRHFRARTGASPVAWRKSVSVVE